MNRPNLFLIGAMKSGTTTLHELMARHPQLAMSEPKEPCWFVAPADLQAWWPEMWRRGFWKSEAAYLAIFPAKPGARYLGESSTDYTKRPKLDGIVERIAAYAADARFVYIMRDPVERTISHYWHMVELRGEARPPLQAIVEEPHYTEVSHYVDQLAPYLQRFGRERVHALTFEELKRDPVAAVRGVFEWLGVDTDFVPDAVGSAHNVTPEEVKQKRAGMGLLDRLRHSDAWTAVGPLVPPAVRKLGVALVEKPVLRREVDLAPVVAHLRPLQQAQTRVLEAQLGRRFDDWKTLWGGTA
ncbi:MAG: sulfotransferase [Betaproteobacteria bacterium]|nr:sulfotransferase [Betaproteobacteria bacterium]